MPLSGLSASAGWQDRHEHIAPLPPPQRVREGISTQCDAELVAAVTNKTPTGAFRGTGGPESAFCLGRTLDLVAKDLGLDPAEVRRRNYVPADAFPYTT